MHTICIFDGNNHQEAFNVKQILESNGIPVIMPSENISAVIPFRSVASINFAVFVSARQFLEAADVLSLLNIKIANQHLIDNLEEIRKYKNLEMCPNCGNIAVETVTEKSTDRLILFLKRIGFPVKTEKTIKRCHLCGEKTR